MPISSPTLTPPEIKGASSTKITNLAMTTSGTEYSLALQSGLKQILIRSRNNEELKLAFTSGDTFTNYVTIKPRAVFTLDNLSFSGVTVYLQSNSDLTVTEIVELF